MIYVTGDMHGEAERFRDRAVKRLKKGDILIVCGDFGFLWDGCEAEKKRLRTIGRQRFTTLFIDGTHDNLPLIRSYPEETLFGGRVRRIDGNLLYAERGEVLELEGRRFFFLGGGASNDMEERVEGQTWWPEELPTGEELEHAARNLDRFGNEVDCIITHQPSDRLRVFLQGGGEQITPLGAFLTRVEQECRFQRWYFGQLHQDRNIPPRHRLLFQDVASAGE